MKFNVVTEKTIRSPYLENARFLLNYQHPVPPVEMMSMVDDILKEKRTATAQEIIETAFTTRK